jgi:hypothetical protein
MTDAVPKPRQMSGKLFLLFIALGLGVLAIVFFATRSVWRPQRRRAECETRLRELAVAARLYRDKFGAWPAATGPAFWELAVRGSGYEPEKKTDFVHCPVTGKAYRGPAAPPRESDPEAWLGCCEPGTHGKLDVVVITAAGTIVTAPKDDAKLGGLSAK